MILIIVYMFTVLTQDESAHVKYVQWDTHISNLQVTMRCGRGGVFQTLKTYWRFKQPLRMTKN